MRTFVLLTCLCVCACNEAGGVADAGADAAVRDGGSDAGKPDSGNDEPDAGRDGGAVDAGRDAGQPPIDAGPFDAGPFDAGHDPCIPRDAGVDAGIDAGPCVPRAASAAQIGMMCEDPLGTPDPGMCTTGYECMPFVGIRLGYSCEIPCASDCECPSSSTCGERCDKACCIRVCQPS